MLTRCSSTPKRRDLGETRGLDHSHAAVERLVAAPMLQVHLRSGMNLHGIARQHVDLSLDVRRIAEFDQRRAGIDHGRALLQHAEHSAGDRRVDREVPATVAVGGEFSAVDLDQRARLCDVEDVMPVRRRLVGARSALRSSSGLGLLQLKLGDLLRRFASSAIPRSCCRNSISAFSSSALEIASPLEALRARLTSASAYA